MLSSTPENFRDSYAAKIKKDSEIATVLPECDMGTPKRPKPVSFSAPEFPFRGMRAARIVYADAGLSVTEGPGVRLGVCALRQRR